ncbi:MAG: DUF1345 domain-containing protein [Hyphomicrobiaceae bacterium]
MEHARPARHGRWYHPGSLARGLAARPKVIFAIVASVVVGLVEPTTLPLSVRSTGAWMAGAVVYLAMAFAIMSSHGTGRIRRTAEAEDESRFVFSTVILLAAAASFVAVIALSSDARGVHGLVRVAYVALAVGTIVSSWLVIQVVFTLHYAHAYHRPASPGGSEPARGLAFPGDDEPDYWDFFYFTTSIGATAQTADVGIVSKAARRIATVQAVLSYIFNAAILALAVNLASSL